MSDLDLDAILAEDSDDEILQGLPGGDADVLELDVPTANYKRHTSYNLPNWFFLVQDILREDDDDERVTEAQPRR